MLFHPVYRLSRDQTMSVLNYVDASPLGFEKSARELKPNLNKMQETNLVLDIHVCKLLIRSITES